MTPSPSRLSESQSAIIDFIGLADGEGLVLAHDIAVEVGVSPRSMGFRLQGLERRGLIERYVVKRRASTLTDDLYGWQLTDYGRAVGNPS